MTNSIGIVGAGFVGTAVKEFFEYNGAHALVYDLDPAKRNCESISCVVDAVDIVFVAVPTPMKPNGECDTSIVHSVIAAIASVARDSKITVLLKSTVPPTTTRRLVSEFGDRLTIVFNPEFLTEARATQDFANQSYIILGGDDVVVAKELYHTYFPNVPVIVCSSDEAELVKYTTNSFLATKVIFANEINRLATELDIDYDAVRHILARDSRLGQTHWQVPGPDGRYGFGGSCFPKDMVSLITAADNVGINMSLLRMVWEENILYRPERDWELLKGRAVV